MSITIDKQTLEALHDFLLEKAKKARKRLAVFLDEVRTVESWEKVVRSLQDRGDCDLFVATSGADPFLGESAALLSDRIVRFEVTPYSFREFRAVRKSLCPDASEDAVWQDFLVWGGMPAAANRPVLSDAEPYLIDVFRSILLCDVTNRRNLRDTSALGTTLVFAAFLASQRQTVSRDTIADYLRAAADAGLLLEVEGDDPNPPLRRRPERFFADHGFREALSSGLNERDPEPALKNIVFLELRRRGCSSAQEESGRSTSSPRKKKSVSMYRSAAFWTRGKPSSVRSSPSTTSRTTGPNSSFPRIRCFVRRTASDTKTSANGSSRTTEGPAGEEKARDDRFRSGPCRRKNFLRDQSRSSTAAKNPSVLFTCGSIWK